MKPESKIPFLARHPVGSGVLFWSIFSIVAVILRGVRWDENYEFAQVILGQIPYPEGHPLYQYVRSFFSLQTYSLAAFMHFAPGPLWANGLRNVLFLALSTIPVYLWGYQLSKRPLIGHCAVVFVLLKVHASFYGSYPILVWPHIFSNGPIGLGYMLLTLWALTSHRHRFAGFLLGFAPLVHLGQFPPLLACSVLYILWNLHQRRYAAMKTLFLAALPGIATTLAFGLFLRGFAVAPPTEGPYFSAADPMVLWHNYMAHYASHRAIPYTTGHLVLIGALLIAAQSLVLRFLRNRSHPDATGKLLDAPSTWAGIYIAVAISTVWIIMAAHYVLGSDIPYLLAGWLPYRLMNHVAPLLIPLMLTIAFRRDQKTPLWLPPLLLVALFAPLLDVLLAFLAPLMDTLGVPFVPTSNGVVEQSVADRYVASGAYLFFFLFGAAGVSIVVRTGRLARSWGIGLGFGLLFTLVALALSHRYGAACATLGVLAGLAPIPRRLPPRFLCSATTCLVGLLLAAMLARDYEQRAWSHLHTTPFEKNVAAYLEQQGEEDAMILVPHQQVGMQMKLGHPVMTDMITLLIAAYRPAIAPSVSTVFQDFYGIYLDPDAPVPDRELAWHEVWPAKPLEEWQRLSTKYDVTYVIARDFMNLPLELVVVGKNYYLYRIPAPKISSP
jgi:hypothetical protein